MSDKQQQLFKTRLVPGKTGPGKLFEEEFVVDDGSKVSYYGILFKLPGDEYHFSMMRLKPIQISG